MNKKNFWVVVFQLLKVFNGLISVFLVPIFLSSLDQGMWFLMLSFGSILLLFSASQNSIVLIFGSHEFKSLQFRHNKILGDIKNINNLYSFILYSKSFFLLIFSLLSIVVFLLYFYYIDNYNYIFFIYTIGLLFFAINYSVLSYIESFREIETAYILKSILMCLLVLLNGVFLYMNMGVSSLAISMLISMVIGFLYIFVRYKKLIFNISSHNLRINSLKKRLFLNYFTKNSFSMVSGFLLFQIYTPMVYFFSGEVIAGKVGLSIAIFLALFSVSTSLLQVKLPFIIQLIANKEYQKAYKMYFDISKNILWIYTALMLLGTYLLFNVNLFEVYKERVVSFQSFLILGFSWYLQIFVFFMITYTRLFKRELFIIPTVFSVIYIISVTIILLNYFETKYIFLGFLTSYLFAMPWIYIKYKKFIRSRS